MTTDSSPDQTPDAASLAARFIEHLRARLSADREMHDLSRNAELARFPLIGFHTSVAAVDFVAFCVADGMTESQVVARRDEFFDAVRHVSREYGLKPRGRNPNGLLAFVFGEGCSVAMARFIRKQTRISHAAATGAVVVSWALDLKTRLVHTHENPVSVFPPVMVLAQTVYPGLSYLESLVESWEDVPVPRSGEKPRRTDSRRPPPLDPPIGPEPAIGPGLVRILFLGANPRRSQLDLGREVSRIQRDLRMARERDNLVLKQEWAVTRDTLMQALLEEPPSIVHFAGHGEKDGIILLDDVGEPQKVSGESLASLFRLFQDTVKCVVLNACWSEAQARAIRQHIPHVVGTRAQISDSAAVAFTIGFYMAIGAGKDIRFAFDMGRARVQMEEVDSEDLLVLL